MGENGKHTNGGGSMDRMNIMDGQARASGSKRRRKHSKMKLFLFFVGGIAIGAIIGALFLYLTGKPPFHKSAQNNDGDYDTGADLELCSSDPIYPSNRF